MVERDVARAMAESYPGYLPDYVKEAEKISAQFGGALSTDDVLAVWDRHPAWAPGGKYWRGTDDDRWPSGWWTIPATILGAVAWLLIARIWL